MNKLEDLIIKCDTDPYYFSCLNRYNGYWVAYGYKVGKFEQKGKGETPTEAVENLYKELVD